MAKPTSTTPKYTVTDANGTVVYSSNTDGNITITNNGTFYAGNGGETINVTSSGATTVYLNNAGDSITGTGAGTYSFFGGNGKDFITGGAHNDVLGGGNGADSVNGGAGNDNITGGNGGDFLTGGGDNDTFIYTSYLESVYQLGKVNTVTSSTLGTAPFDVITDFGTGSGDKLDLSALDSQLTGSGPTKLVWDGSQGSDSDAGNANGSLIHGVWTDTTGSFVYADVNGDGKADLKIQVSNVDGNSFIGVDHAPVISGGTFSGSVTELADTTGSSATDSVSPPTTINFTDQDLTDTHTASFVVDASNTTSYGTFALDGVVETVGSGTGSVDWHFGVTDSAIDFLAAGESVVQKYDVSVLDNWGASATQVITVTINGANDDAVISLVGTDSDAGSVTEDQNSGGPGVETSSGTLSFGDVDLSNIHSVSVTGGSYGSLTFDPLTDTTGTGTGGVISWHYSVNDTAIDSLNTGDHPQDIFTVDLFDGTSHVTHTVTITINGVTDVVASDSDTSHDYDTVQSVIDGGFLTQTQVDNANTIPNGGSQTFTGSSGNDVVIGNDNSNTINLQNGNDTGLGLGGSDTINGSNGNDQIFGQAGDDNLAGGNDTDVIYGGSGNDTIAGNGGADTVWGGSGNDTFTYGATADSSGATVDTIEDFHPGFDKIDVSGVDANTALINDQAFATGGTTIGSTAIANGVWATVSGSDTILHFDVNGNTAGADDMQIVLANFTGTLHASDFVL